MVLYLHVGKSGIGSMVNLQQLRKSNAHHPLSPYLKPEIKALQTRESLEMLGEGSGPSLSLPHSHHHLSPFREPEVEALSLSPLSLSLSLSLSRTRG
jgi:hypothetical protein